MMADRSKMGAEELAAERAEYIRRIVDNAPPLSDAQRELLRRPRTRLDVHAAQHFRPMTRGAGVLA